MSKRAAEDSDSAESSKRAKLDDSENSSGLQKDDEGNLYLDLGSMKRASIGSFRGKTYVNLREYYVDKSSGAMKPGKKGITLDPGQWASLVANVGRLTKQLELAESSSSAPAKTKPKEAKPKVKQTAKKTAKKKTSDDEEAENDDEDYKDE